MEYVTLAVVPDEQGHWQYLAQEPASASKVGIQTRGAWPRPVQCRVEGIDLLWKDLGDRAGQVMAACNAAVDQGRVPVKMLPALIGAVSPDSVAVRVAIRLGPLGLGSPEEWVRTSIVWPGDEVLRRLRAVAARKL